MQEYFRQQLNEPATGVKEQVSVMPVQGIQSVVTTEDGMSCFRMYSNVFYKHRIASRHDKDNYSQAQ